ncbi:UDP-N-acetylmuramoylalanine--D-glutamate ligase [Marinobacterium nitratireducens]|uniref:UDP-N-acetylmuramoylalanine--D-glutamate ligase n=1 Tax=Marinobacterium nitratireducens TaxID=518897 RepID=A0A918DST4_9GAMM|nr:UDP-N-acetylmuramoyl-L-alanine--D-glutamate ligase [Marinobacterium nitratireducens]GGO82527.1 UDP-N-acetylmuramoylalanine--D-glutamate ligase [Marinobacterium nitratireducens]
MSLISTDRLSIVIGLGQTGLSCVRHLLRSGKRFAVADTREQPPGLEQLQTLAPDVEVRCGELDADFLSRADELVLSPGVDQRHPAIRAAVARGARLTGDIDLFCREISAPVIAITGSNAKSTVTTLVGEMARAAGIDVGVGGNLGTPVLDMLAAGEQALYVLELSSFQLETTSDLRAEVATVLNVSPDHMDRYDSVQDYYRAKHRIFRGARKVVENRDDPLTHPLLPGGVDVWGYRLGKPDLKVFGLLDDAQGQSWLALGLERLLPVSELRIRGMHNVANALAALAIGTAAGLPRAAMLTTLRAFSGLEHRCQWVAEKRGVAWFNDSKGTNVGATVAALNGLGPTLAPGAGVVLIAGGDGKGAEFGELDGPLARFGRALVLIGRDAPRIDGAVGSLTQKCYASSMDEAVEKAAALAQPGDLVLLSPACASFDMFSGYGERGRQFVDAVGRLT